MALRMLVASLILVLLAAPSSAHQPPNGKRDVEKICACLQKRGTHTRFLKLFKSSGFAAIVARYVQTQPVTLLVPSDAAFSRLPLRFQNALKGANAIRLMEYHMMLHLFPADYLRLCLNTAFFDSVLGNYIYKQASVNRRTIVLSSKKKADISSIAVVTCADCCGLQTRTIAVQVINSVLIPPGMFSTETH